MNIAMVAMTDRGLATVQRLSRGLPEEANRRIFVHEKAIGQQIDGIDGIQSFRHLREIIGVLWQESAVLIFVMASGIVVRHIAPFLQGKDRDPAVLVLDEAGKFIIPLLSGHLGGANAWANRLAVPLGATPVITTATDGRGLVAPDELARRKGWKVEPLKHLPAVNRLLLERGYLNVWVDDSFEIFTPTGSAEVTLAAELDAEHYRFLTHHEKEKADVIFSVFPDPNSSMKEDNIYWIPPVLHVGVGCRRGISTETVLEEITRAVKQIGASIYAVAGIYSIALKAGETGLIEAAKFFHVPFRTFDAGEIQEMIEREHLSQSELVKEKIGVDGVCEAASLLGAQMGQLILPKTKGRGVTVAISLANSLS